MYGTYVDPFALIAPETAKFPEVSKAARFDPQLTPNALIEVPLTLAPGFVSQSERPPLQTVEPISSWWFTEEFPRNVPPAVFVSPPTETPNGAKSSPGLVLAVGLLIVTADVGVPPVYPRKRHP
jgi:hypothetical protein